MIKRITAILIVCLMSIFSIGCTSSNGQTSSETLISSSARTESESNRQKAYLEDDGISASQSEGLSDDTYTGGWGLMSDDFIEQFVERYDELESYAIDELEDRKNAVPIHAALGEEVEATGNLAVSVVSVEPGPYDYADNTPTVKVTVAMRNLTGKAISVKASNWDADNGNGQRVDHKLYIKDERGKRDVRSFYPTKVSPNATFTGVVYFDGDALKSVIYEPHWLVSSQNQYIYFDL